MNITTRIAFLWLLIAVGISIHSLLKTAAYVFFSDEKLDLGNEIPMENHIISIVAMILPMVFALCTLFFKSKTLVWIAFIYSILLALLNTFHASEPLSSSPLNISQAVLLTFIAVVNIVLVLQLNKWRKEVS
ncbi:MAG: hypothetical protein AAFP82_02010 [Bacteroidota bacterium]